MKRFIGILVFLFALTGATSGALAGDLNTQLYDAAKQGQVDVVLTLLDQGADVNAKDSYGFSALMAAAYEGQVNVVRVLLDRGADANLKDKKGYTALLAAACEGKADVVRVLLERGADVNAKDDEGSTVLMWAIEFKGRADVVAALLDRGANINATDKNGCTALILAAYAGKADVVSILLDRGADANAHVDNEGYTALMWAAFNGKIDVVRILLAKGADMKAENNYGNTALSLAITAGRTDIVQLINNAQNPTPGNSNAYSNSYPKPILDGVMGIPWGAAPRDVQKVMKKNGFTFWQEYNDPVAGYCVTYADGLYAGYSVSGLTFVFLANQLYSVSVSISEKRANIDAAYSDIGRLLTDKYGSPGPEKTLRIPVNCPPNPPYELITVCFQWSLANGPALPYTIELKKTPAWVGYEKYLGGVDVSYVNNALREALKAQSRQGI